MAIDDLSPPVASGSTIDGQRVSLPTDRRRPPARRPAMTLLRSLAMGVLAIVGILVLLPAAIAAQAASAL